ncbi:flagellar protein FlgN [Clostridium cellulovorans]|uniref:FlgN family protein n=1 Tax=Clostridium cellulovorans (strain ATCC 35296 / DSM 3052 / OCM 3 / 743B) TaxID=573061 RepID=D9SKE8_CLOC7|nr:flagellar protein FlgN [Clostridium cellulovorans]ADL51444.1 FlgN family protein [Clostridium cellulovorans 743B]
MILTELKNVLVDELKALKDLLSCLEKQQEFIVANDAFKLDGIVSDIQEKTSIVAKFETVRRRLLNNQDIKKVVDESEDDEIKKIYEEITLITKKLVFQKETNDMLIKQSLIFVNKMLSYLSPNKEAKSYNAYGKMRR